MVSHEHRLADAEAINRILAERSRQISAEGWSMEADDARSPGEWLDLIAVTGVHINGIMVATWEDAAEIRRAMIRVAATAVACIGAIDRRVE